jgi:plastocyanin
MGHITVDVYRRWWRETFLEGESDVLENTHSSLHRTAMRFSLLLMVPVLLGVLVACGSAAAVSTTTPAPVTHMPTAGASSTDPTPTATTAQPTPAQGSPQTVMIITNSDGSFGFSPSTLTIKAGTTVIWKNMSSASHTVTSDDGQTFDSGTVAVGGTFHFTFTTKGTFPYHCNFHPYMRATIIVV